MTTKNFDETYDGATDNLLSRKRTNNPQETFGYDNLDRLVSVKNGATETMKINYAPNGNILFKTGVGNFSYDKNTRPHAVTEVENTDGKIPSDALTTSFNDFGKIELIEDAGIIVYAASMVGKYRSAGTYTMYSYDEEVLRSPAVSGAGNIRSYTLPSGNYSVIAINNRAETKFTRKGVGWTANLSPDPFYDEYAGRNRQYIRIHPARSLGTEEDA